MRRSKTSLCKLLDESNESYYWLGYLLTDGHFSSRNTICLNVSAKDKILLESFLEFLGNYKLNNKPDKRNLINLQLSDRDVVIEIKQKYGITNHKTTIPVSLDFLTNLSTDQVLSFIIGFIDGDGSISKSGQIQIRMHGSWQGELQKLIDIMQTLIPENRVNCKKKIVKIDKRGYAIVFITNPVLCDYLKSQAKSLGLPCLTRKWERIQNKLESRKIKSWQTIKKILELASCGNSVKNIATEINCCVSYVRWVIRSHRMSA